jgi:hypothetical protein
MAEEEMFVEAKFNPMDLDKFNTPEDRVNYLLGKGFKKIKSTIGAGSSRFTVAIDSKHALKVALNDAGQAQNQQEAANIEKIKSNLMPKFYRMGMNAQWILVELARPFSNPQELAGVLGMDLSDCLLVVQYAVDYNSIKDYAKAVLSKKETFPIDDMKLADVKVILVNTLKTPVATELFRLAKEYDFDLEDLNDIGQWGIASDGRIVILDVGFSESVGKAHYGGKSGVKLKTQAYKTVHQHLNPASASLKEYIELVVKEVLG